MSALEYAWPFRCGVVLFTEIFNVCIVLSETWRNCVRFEDSI